MKKEDILTWIANGENSGIEFKRDDVRPEQLAKEIVALSSLATREEQMRLFQEGGFVHIETLPVSGTTLSHLDVRRLQDYFGRIRKLALLPQTEAEWTQTPR